MESFQSISGRSESLFGPDQYCPLSSGGWFSGDFISWATPTPYYEPLLWFMIKSRECPTEKDYQNALWKQHAPNMLNSFIYNIKGTTQETQYISVEVVEEQTNQ